MALDKSDKRLVNGLILAVVFFGVVYFWPGWFGVDGISGAYERLAERRASLKSAGSTFSQFYAPMQPAHFGEVGEQSIVTADVAPISGLKKIYDDANDVTNQFIRIKKKANRMVFPYWTDIPENERNPGSYFRLVWDDKRFKVAQRCQNANVELDATDIGFDRIRGTLPDEAKSKELLRELYITETIIDLCIQAKLAEEAREKALNIKSEAFMRILTVDPKDSEPTGPTALINNPKFDPSEKNPGSPKFRKYNIESFSNFIQEYPVKIQLICDYNTFIQFMYSVRTTKDPNGRFEFRGSEIRDGQTIAHLRIIDDELNKQAKAGRPVGGQNLRWIDDELNFEVRVGDILQECKYTVTRIDKRGVIFSDENRQQIVVPEGQFLVMRQLEILSPAFEDSKSDKTEMTPFKSDTSDINAKKHWPDKPEQIVVTLVAAGMDFFDPIKQKYGLHPKTLVDGGMKPGVRPGRRTIIPNASKPPLP